MDLDAQIRALEDQVAREADELEKARQARAAEAFAGQAHPPHSGDATVQADGSGKPPPRFEKDADDRSIFIQGIPSHPDITPELIAEGFQDCGPILKCTLLRNRATNELKGTAYIEFGTYEAVGRAIDTKTNLQFRGSTLTVSKKRSHFAPGRGRGRGATRGAGGRGGGDRSQEMMANMMSMMMGAVAQLAGARGGRGRGRGRGTGQAFDAAQGQDSNRPARGGFKPF
jgi:hypothetical protein